MVRTVKEDLSQAQNRAQACRAAAGGRWARQSHKSDWSYPDLSTQGWRQVAAGGAVSFVEQDKPSHSQLRQGQSLPDCLPCQRQQRVLFAQSDRIDRFDERHPIRSRSGLQDLIFLLLWGTRAHDVRISRLSAGKDNRAVLCFKYMLMCKVMSNNK